MTPVAGPTHPTWKHGRTSRYLPPDVADRVREISDDPNFLSIRGDAALLAARQTELMERLSANDSVAWRNELKATWAEWELANRLSREAKKDLESGDEGLSAGATARIQKAQELAQAALVKLKSLIEGGGKRDDAWNDLVSFTHETVSLKKSEGARLATAQQMMTCDEVVSILVQLQLAIVEVVKDQKQRAEIGVRFAKLLNFGGAGGGGGGAGLPSPAGPSVGAGAIIDAGT